MRKKESFMKNVIVQNTIGFKINGNGNVPMADLEQLSEVTECLESSK